MVYVREIIPEIMALLAGRGPAKGKIGGLISG